MAEMRGKGKEELKGFEPIPPPFGLSPSTGSGQACRRLPLPSIHGKVRKAIRQAQCERLCFLGEMVMAVGIAARSVILRMVTAYRVMGAKSGRVGGGVKGCSEG